MSRNRMKNSQSLHWMGVLKWILIIGLMSILGLSYMSFKNQNLHVANEIHHMTNNLDEIQKQNDQLTSDLTEMTSRVKLKTRLVQMGLSSQLVSVATLNPIAMDQGTRMRIARMVAEPNQTLNLDSQVSPVATSSQH